MYIAHISDLHIFDGAPPAADLRPDTVDAARKVVADIVSFTPKIDAVAITGDLTHDGEAEAHALLADVLTPIDVPVFIVPGNHDRRDLLRAAFRDRLPLPDTGPLHYEASLGDIRILALDTLVEGAAHGALCETQLDWLEDRLATRHTGATLILIHHPGFTSGIHVLDRIALRSGADRFDRLVGGYPGALRILAGHIHRPMQAFRNGAFWAIGGSPSCQLALDLDSGRDKAIIVDEPYAWFLHRIDAADPASVCIHTRYVEL